MKKYSKNTVLSAIDELDRDLVDALASIGHKTLNDLQRLGVRMAWRNVPASQLPKLVDLMKACKFQFLDFKSNPELLLNDDLRELRNLSPATRVLLRKKEITSIVLLRLLTPKDLELLLNNRTAEREIADTLKVLK